MATATQSSTMSKELFHASREFLSLTEKQMVWVDVLISSQDAALATRTAYGDQTDEPYRAMLCRKVETSPRVIAALDLFYGRSPRERFVRDLQNDIARSKGIAKIEARRLYAKMVFGVDGQPTEEVEHPVCKIGDIVLVEGVQHRVTAVDASGRPTDGDRL